MPSLEDVLFLCQEEMVDGFLCVESSEIADAKLTVLIVMDLSRLCAGMGCGAQWRT